MPKKYKAILAIFVIFLALGVGVFLSYQYQTVIREDLGEMERTEETEPEAAPETLEWDDIFYGEEDGVIKLAVTGTENDRLLSEDHPSRPKISPQGSYLSYIAPSEWEQVGSLYKYDLTEDDIVTLVEGADLPEQHTVKDFWWLDESTLLFIGGFAYGTVSVGGSLYGLDLETEQIVEIFAQTERSEVKNIEIIEEEEQVLLEIAEFDEDFIEHEVINEYIELNYVYEQVGSPEQ